MGFYQALLLFKYKHIRPRCKVPPSLTWRVTGGVDLRCSMRYDLRGDLDVTWCITCGVVFGMTCRLPCGVGAIGVTKIFPSKKGGQWPPLVLQCWVLARVPYKRFLQEFLTRGPCKRSLQKVLTRVPYE